MPTIDPQEAWRLLRERLEPLPPERIPRRRAAARVLAEDLAATVDVPAHDVSAMDGYILSGTVVAGARLPVTGVVAAGDPPGFELAPGTAARIMTGAPVPSGGDRVIPVEQTDDGDQEVCLDADPGPGAHIRRQGEVQRAGSPLLAAGSPLSPGALSLLATHGIGEIAVHRHPKVNIVTTGDEVVAPDTVPGPGQLRDSHTDFLLAAGASLGLDFQPLGTSRDDPEELARYIERGLGGDVLLLCGGVSKGEYDFVEEVLERFGHRPLFDAVAIQPGKPLVATVAPGSLVFGLPGNPGSVMVCFWLFVRPALRVLMGSPDAYWHGALRATLDAPLPGAKDRDRFMAASVVFADGELRVTPHLPRGSHDVAAYALGLGLVRIPARAEPAGPGDPCEVLPLADWRPHALP